MPLLSVIKTPPSGQVSRGLFYQPNILFTKGKSFSALVFYLKLASCPGQINNSFSLSLVAPRSEFKLLSNFIREIIEHSLQSLKCGKINNANKFGSLLNRSLRRDVDRFFDWERLTVPTKRPTFFLALRREILSFPIKR